MSAINIGTQIPNAIVTAEQLAAWIGLLLARANPSLAVLEADDRSELVAQSAIFTDANDEPRLLIRLSIPLESAYTTDTRKLWMSAKELSNTQIPTAFTSN